MNARLLYAVMVSALTIGCSGMSVNHDWDRQADFSKYQTYSWHDSDTNVQDTNPLAHERFITAVNGQTVLDQIVGPNGEKINFFC